MKILENIFRSVWVWLIMIISLTYYFSQSTKKKINTSQRIELENSEITESLFIITRQGIVEVAGGIIKVSASRTGTIKEVYVMEGSYVNKGDLLALQEDRDDRIIIRKAQIAIASAKIQQKQETLNLITKKRELGRAELQYEQEAISQQEFDNTKDSYENAKLSNEKTKLNFENLQTNLETARFNLTRRRLISPTNGRILTSYVTVGAGVSADNISTAFKIIPDAPKRVRVKIGQIGLGKIYVGQSVQIKDKLAVGSFHDGNVASIGDVFSSVTANGTVERNTVDVIIDSSELPFRLGENVVVHFKKNGTKFESETQDE